MSEVLLTCCMCCGIFYPRMVAKIKTSYEQLDGCCDEMERLKAMGVIDGFDDKQGY